MKIKAPRGTKKQLGVWEREREANRKGNRLVRIEISTRVPSKWLFVDQETGDVWKWDSEKAMLVHQGA